MGYSHSFHAIQPIEMGKWLEITEALAEVIKNLPEHSSSAGGHYVEHPLILQREYDDNSKPLMNRDEIRFNGAGELGHETFQLRRRESERYAFCKTNRKPYDFAVCAALILTHRYAPGHCAIKSDGEPGDWRPALIHCKETLGISDLELPPGVIDYEYDYVKMAPVEPWWKMNNAPAWF